MESYKDHLWMYFCGQRIFWELFSHPPQRSRSLLSVFPSVNGHHSCSYPFYPWSQTRLFHPTSCLGWGMTYDLVHSLKNPPSQYPQCGLRVVYQFSATYSGVFLVSRTFHLFSVLVAFSKHPVLPSIIHFIEASTPWLSLSPGDS